MEEDIDPRLIELYRQQRSANESNLIRFQLDNTGDLELLKMDLLGLKYNEDGDMVEDAHKTPMLNQRGAETVLSFLRPRAGKIFSLSNHEDDDIDKRCLRYIDGLTFLLGRHQKEFDIQSYPIMDSIIDLCDDMFRATLLKSADGWEGDGIRKQHTTVESRETITENKPPQKMPFVNPFKGGA